LNYNLLTSKFKCEDELIIGYVIVK
jgi:hypothetical protein